MSDYKKINESGYDAVSQKYHNDRDLFDTSDILSEFHVLLKPRAEVLDAGCGSGVPVAKDLVEAGYNVTGIDISSSMLSLAREHVPEAVFHKMNMKELSFKDEAFGGVVTCYSFFHVPAAEQPTVLAEFHRVLQPNGGLMITTGIEAREGVGQMYDADIYWSCLAPDDTLEMVKKSGFDIVNASVRCCGGETHFWVYARKSNSS